MSDPGGGLPPPAAEVPSAWSVYVPILTGFVRAVLAALGGVGFTWAMTVNADQIQMAVSVAMMLAAAGWSAWQKLDAARKSRASSVASADQSAAATQAAGVPVPVVVETKAAA